MPVTKVAKQAPSATRTIAGMGRPARVGKSMMTPRERSSTIIQVSRYSRLMTNARIDPR